MQLALAVMAAGCSPSVPASPSAPVTLNSATASPCASTLPSAPASPAAPASQSGPASPETVAEGALRSRAEAEVAPPDYRCGKITDSQAAAWFDRVEREYRRWYASPMLDRMLAGLEMVVNSHRQDGVPIVASVDITSVHVPFASITGDVATVEEASISYVYHFVAETWSPTDVPGSTGCWYTLHRAAAGWRVVDASCNVSGG
jgi:hypothetical protein